MLYMGMFGSETCPLTDLVTVLKTKRGREWLKKRQRNRESGPRMAENETKKPRMAEKESHAVKLTTVHLHAQTVNTCKMFDKPPSRHVSPTRKEWLVVSWQDTDNER